MKRILIELDFEGKEEITESDVINYINELIENDSLNYSEIEVTKGK